MFRQTHSVMAFLINVHFYWHSGLVQSGIEVNAVLDGHYRVFGRCGEKGGRRLTRHVQLIRQQADKSRVGIFAKQVIA